MQFLEYQTPSAWKSKDFKDCSWIDILSKNQREELLMLAKSLPANEDEWLTIAKSDLALNYLKPVFIKTNEELDRGRGFVLLRDLGINGDDIDLAYRVNWILALGLGDVIAQNANGEVIGAVQAVVQADDNGANTRGYVSNAELRFHCDGGDVASLVCVRQAPEGGLSSLVSMISIHNAIVKECPEHLETLYEGFHLYGRKEGDMDSSISPLIPIFMPKNDHLLCFINLRLMELPYETQGKPMPQEKRAALDAIEEIAERPEYKLQFKLQPGDMLLVQNYTCMHKRSGFTDDPDPEKSRLMLRLWYNIRGGRGETIQAPEKRAGYFDKSPYVIRHK